MRPPPRVPRRSKPRRSTRGYIPEPLRGSEQFSRAASTGAFFAVSRKLPGQSAFVGVGGTSGSTAETRRPSFTDATVPASAASQGAQYIVQGFRGTRVGDASDAVIVQFGVEGLTITSASGATFKMAA